VLEISAAVSRVPKEAQGVAAAAMASLATATKKSKQRSIVRIMKNWPPIKIYCEIVIAAVFLRKYFIVGAIANSVRVVAVNFQAI
jgi:hypothetical protein